MRSGRDLHPQTQRHRVKPVADTKDEAEEDSQEKGLKLRGIGEIGKQQKVGKVRSTRTPPLFSASSACSEFHFFLLDRLILFVLRVGYLPSRLLCASVSLW